MEIPYYNTVLDKYFEVLEVSKDTSYEDIKKTYRKLAHLYHPDKNIDNKESEEKMKQINEAYEILKSEQTRISYVKKYGVYTNRSTLIDLAKTRKQEELEALKKSIQSLKETYQEVRNEEKKSSFKERFKRTYSKFEEEDYFGNFASPITTEGMRITCILGLELFYQLQKLKKQQSDNIQRYTIRNRKTLAGILLACMLFNTSEVNVQAEEATTPAINTEESNRLLLSQQRLTRIYSVKPGDSLESIAKEANTTVERIVEENRLYSKNITREQNIKIPYLISNEDLKYYTISVNTADFETLEDLAEAYQTDVRTIFSLNIECFEKLDGKYFQTTDTLLVPVFKTQEEINALKSKKVYQKS